jgi:hypothetical protein
MKQKQPYSVFYTFQPGYDSGYTIVEDKIQRVIVDSINISINDKLEQYIQYTCSLPDNPDSIYFVDENLLFKSPTELLNHLQNNIVK